MHNSEILQIYIDRLIRRSGRAHIVEALDGARTALLVVDMQYFFMDDEFPACCPVARDIVPNINRLAAATRWTVYGGSCTAYAQIASGRIDVGLDVGFDVYDYLALAPIIEGAGGIISDWQGAPLTLASGDRILAAGDRRIHDAVLALLAN